MLDGTQYTTVIPAPAILDALIARGRILATGGRVRGHLVCPRLTSELLAAVQRRACPPTSCRGSARRITRASRRATWPWPDRASGGLASTPPSRTPACSATAPTQSGSVPVTPDAEAEWLTRQVRQAPALPLRFFLESARPRSPPSSTPIWWLRDALRSNGATVDYREFNGNHHYLPWRSGFADGLCCCSARRRPNTHAGIAICNSTEWHAARSRPSIAVLFDVDGTLIDSNAAHARDLGAGADRARVPRRRGGAAADWDGRRQTAAGDRRSGRRVDEGPRASRAARSELFAERLPRLQATRGARPLVEHLLGSGGRRSSSPRRPIGGDGRTARAGGSGRPD